MPLFTIFPFITSDELADEWSFLRVAILRWWFVMVRWMLSGMVI